MGIDRVHFGAAVAGELLPDFLWQTGGCQCGVKAVSQRVKRQAREHSSATGLCSLAFDACLFHDRVETPTQDVLSLGARSRLHDQWVRCCTVRYFPVTSRGEVCFFALHTAMVE